MLTFAISSRTKRIKGSINDCNPLGALFGLRAYAFAMEMNISNISSMLISIAVTFLVTDKSSDNSTWYLVELLFKLEIWTFFITVFGFLGSKTLLKNPSKDAGSLTSRESDTLPLSSTRSELNLLPGLRNFVNRSYA